MWFYRCFTFFKCLLFNSKFFCSLYLNPVLAKHRSDPQWYWEDGTTVHICRAIYGGKVSFSIGANLTGDVKSYETN